METEKVAKKTHGALTILKQFGIHDCRHKDPISGSNCILSMIGKHNKNHYVLATQDRDLQEKLRLKAGVPLLYLHNKSPTLEKPSKASYDKAGQSIESNFTFISETQNQTLKNIKKALGVVEEEAEPKVVIKKKKPHNPNPLSCKKKKKKPVRREDKNAKEGVSDGKVRKRKKKKLPKHLMEQLKASNA